LTGQGQAIITKGEMKFAYFQRPGDVLIIVRSEKSRLYSRMAPRGGIIGTVGCLKKGNQEIWSSRPWVM
jgi:hypothetical protein